jgi:hypothetical protein
MSEGNNHYHPLYRYINFIYPGSYPLLQQLRGVAWTTAYFVSQRDLSFGRAFTGQVCCNKGVAFMRNPRHDGFGSRGLREVLVVFALSCVCKTCPMKF